MGHITFEQIGTGQKMTISIDELADEAKSILEWGYGQEAAGMFVSGVTILEQRPGQAFMNTLRMYDHAEYSRLTSSKQDPFYNDAKLPAAIDKLTSK
jgi:hypothetical protein